MEKTRETVNPNFEKLGEECGVFGIYDFDGNDVANSIYYGLLALQHRGQESCGIAVTDTSAPRKTDLIKNNGLVNEVFNHDNLASLHGNLGVGHVRYATAGDSSPNNAQPLVINYIKGTIMVAHNGNLINSQALRDELARDGAIFQTTVDTEPIAYIIARERISSKTAENAVSAAMKKIKGAYSLIVASPRKLIGARDPYGFRPLCIGKRDNSYVLSSESCALNTIDAEFVRDVEPGEVVWIDKDGLHSDKSNCIPKAEQGSCVFEYIYFARPDSNIDGMSVYDSRILAGKYLAEDSPVDADVVVGVPDSGNAAAIGYSLGSGIPNATGFVKNSYVGRTFIKPGQKNREDAVHVKLNALREAVDGKRVVMVDDSIVRGTTCDGIIQMLRDAGATEVHVRISSPPFVSECFFGTDVPDKELLIAYKRSVDEICKIIGADSLGYLQIDRVKELSGGQAVCQGCFTGEYPMDVREAEKGRSSCESKDQ
ncbi:MAG: amidophosphoribosyltransferase [Eubacterium sp.]|nr:amidophosphoribosyltransferase [Eubacterium sp.]